MILPEWSLSKVSKSVSRSDSDMSSPLIEKMRLLSSSRSSVPLPDSSHSRNISRGRMPNSCSLSWIRVTSCDWPLTSISSDSCRQPGSSARILGLRSFPHLMVASISSRFTVPDPSLSKNLKSSVHTSLEKVKPRYMIAVANSSRPMVPSPSVSHRRKRSIRLPDSCSIVERSDSSCTGATRSARMCSCSLRVRATNPCSACFAALMAVCFVLLAFNSCEAISA